MPGINSYSNAGSIASFSLENRDYDSAYAWFRTGIDEAATLPDKRWLSAAYNNMGILLAKWNRLPEAEQNYRKALEVLFHSSSASDSGLVISIRDNLAELALQAGRPGAALAYYSANAITAATPERSARLKPTAGMFTALLQAGNIPEAGRQLAVR